MPTPGCATTVAADQLEREHVVGEQGGAGLDEVRCDRRLARARRCDEAEGPPVERDGARVEQLEALERGGEREHLREQQALPAPRRDIRERGEDAGAVGRDEMTTVARRDHAIAEALVVVDGHHELPVPTTPFEHPHAPAGTPDPLELLRRTCLEHGRSTAVARRPCGKR